VFCDHGTSTKHLAIPQNPSLFLANGGNQKENGEGGLNRDTGGHQKEKSKEPTNLRTTTRKNSPVRRPP